MNYFEIFNIPVQLKVDKTNLSKKYFELSKKFIRTFMAMLQEVNSNMHWKYQPT
jgi:hypothetical protein